jgi:RelA/SpoT family (p)ppGpp synthetase
MRARPLSDSSESRLRGLKTRRTQEVHLEDTSAPASLRALLALCRRYMPEDDLGLIQRAYAVAGRAHAGVFRKSGEPFIEHPLAVAAILGELAMDAEGIAAALLHDTVEDTGLTLDEVRDRFGPVVAGIVDGVTKFDAVEAPRAGDEREQPADGPWPGPDGAAATAAARAQKAREQAETVRKLFLAMVSDPRVVLLKLADRLHNLRTIGSMPPAKREQKARETLDIYAPLASRIGLYVIKSELEDLAFSCLDPQAYREAIRRLREEEARRASWAKRMCDRIRRELAASHITAAVNWRVKRPYRAWIEARESGIDIGQLHDLIAFRVLVNTQEECYQALGVIHRLWHPYSERIRDYIASPKVNGYQSLHTAVFALDGRLAQMHIRTHAMHRATQHGVAAHWLELAEAEAQDGIPASKMWTQQMPTWVAQLARWQEELRLSAAEFVETLHNEVFEDQVFVFTPKGEVREMPAGSTVLDFAYRIHTDVGSHTTGAQVQTNDPGGALISHFVLPDYVLKTGDIVKVVTDPETRPQPEWLTIASTRYARYRIARGIRAQQRAAERRATAQPDGASAGPAPEATTGLQHPSGKLARVELARCCYPIPGDTVVGLAGAGRQVLVHRACCRTLSTTLARRKLRGAPYSRPVPVGWPQLQPTSYRLLLAIYGQDHRGLMHEVSDRVAQLGLNVSRSQAIAHQDRFKAAIVIALDVPPGVRRDLVLRRLRSVPGVTQVERDSSKGCDETAS